MALVDPQHVGIQGHRWGGYQVSYMITMANDEDDAVPRQQGIEFFTAMRRLGKEAYMFVYNGEKGRRAFPGPRTPRQRRPGRSRAPQLAAHLRDSWESSGRI